MFDSSDPTATSTAPVPERGSTAGAYAMADWLAAYRNVERECENVSLGVRHGSIPGELCGTLVRNGPGRLERGGQWVSSPIDADGMVIAVRFENGSARFSNRMVRTEGWQAEEKAGRFLRRGVFGTAKPGGILANAFDLRIKNTANTSVVRLGDRLLALWEAGLPHRLDPLSLATLGTDTLAGVLRPGEAFSAHPRLDPGHHGAPRLVNFGVTPQGLSTRIRLMELAGSGPAAGSLLSESTHALPGIALLHDFAITPRWAVFLQNAMRFNPLPYVLGLKSAGLCLSSQAGRHGRILLIPRAGGPPVEVDAPACFVFHHLNAFEDDNSGELVLDSIAYDSFPFLAIPTNGDFRDLDYERVPPSRLQRCRIQLRSGEVHTEILEERSCEFAVLHPDLVGREARFVWMAAAARERGSAPQQLIEKLDLHSRERRFWTAGARCFVGEPVMVPRPGGPGEAAPPAEDDGWVLAVVWNAGRGGSDLVILDASTLAEVALLELPVGVPHGLHGSWCANG